ncbi:HlyD family type I secretion periplasmic adaptor subunit [Aliiroseovarius sp. F47248L]|uniref:HlyD family type I secretion periplasmic adaptor subunit n=1 Tax=Aliiroseovarius sp. F47248L TaxID=2926420 RepID=UPI001FF1320A|nr:HlyD family type I secretion periplasmic adaptor subunit [Aliiroseovarius sp. F47248L]MCK0139824.1 HlyD family type I secretion periplasmic adaptor subunit [Aliiroseovarius sp. F47248L]
MDKPDLSARGITLFGFLALAVLIAGFGVWSVTAQIAGAVVADGIIRPDQVHHILRHPEGGVATAIRVNDGMRVNVGDSLLTLDDTRLRSRRTVLESQQGEILARIARLKAEQDSAANITFSADLHLLIQNRPDLAEAMQGQIRLFLSRRDLAQSRSAQLDQRASQIDQQKSGLDAQASALTRQIALLRDDLWRQRELLEQGLAQYPRVAALEREEALLAGRLAEVAASKAEADVRLTETHLQKLSIEAEHREQIIAELRDFQSKAAELSENLRAIDFELEQLTLRAPVSGLVHQMTIHTPQSVVQPGQPILTIIPQDDAVRVAARISPQDIDQLFVTQEVTLAFPALARKNDPVLKAKIEKISADAVTNEQTGQRYYEIEMGIHRTQRAQLPDDVILLPGMPVTAFIKTADRSPLSYLLQPFKEFFRSALREK